MSYRAFRHPKTYRAIRDNAWWRSEFRGTNMQRSKKYQPTSWDDIYRANLYDRCWKRFRKTQWKQL